VARPKRYIGPKIRLLRERSGLTLEACARQLALSASYLSQIENNQRPVTARVLIALSRLFGVPSGEFEADDHSRLIADLKEATADLSLELAPDLGELKLAAATTPRLARQFLALHRAYRALDERLMRLDERVSSRAEDDRSGRTPYQEVRDFFHYRDNYVEELDVAAERLASELGIGTEPGSEQRLARALLDGFGVRVVRTASSEAGLMRRFDPIARVLLLPRDLSEPTRTFQLAAQLASLAFEGVIEGVLAGSDLHAPAALDIGHMGLVNYAAGALLMPYRTFLGSALSLRHDIEQLQRLYGASFEQICHRLSTLQRPGERGVPFYFVRVDQAGNITKRHSSTRFQFARFGGACPLWNVHEAFGHPGRILVQLAEMPDGVRYLCIGRSIVKRSGHYLRPNRQYAIGIGCEIAHADKLVYSAGLPLDGPAVPIGVSCRICERADCHQRAFPTLDRRIVIPRHERHTVPYTLE
jgi:XRE family transcriptional regulator, fatty acid utilization regulator